MVEYTTVEKTTDDGKEEHSIKIHSKVSEGENIREIGSDVKQGELIMNKGELVTAFGGELGVLASVGALEVSVVRKPVVGVLSTGNEIVDFDTPGPLSVGQVRDTNRLTISSISKNAGFECLDLGVAPDNIKQLEDCLRMALEKVDVLVTSGGVSMGELDLKPTTFATLLTSTGSKKLIFALPGNPVSATVMFYIFVLPALRKLSGYIDYKNKIIRTKLLHSIKLDSRPEFYRAVLKVNDEGTGFVAQGTGNQRSSRMMSLRSANSILVLPGRSDSLEEIKKGELVDALLLGPIQ
ncbi:hypothetical protein HK096_011069 [Nowakowskiella sp. JEL0078]|nr:hypothetical protein HK096_011069 [Nowakowskiella sp. JEL0078]